MGRMHCVGDYTYALVARKLEKYDDCIDYSAEDNEWGHSLESATKLVNLMHGHTRFRIAGDVLW